uniref:Uncharacterized protein n=1 Tax=Corethrella appendiculata TaxID=1370023 RepID=U5EPV7_9DIPT
MHCIIRNCETDENIVNSTSVFFIPFPKEDQNLRQQWFDSIKLYNNQSIEDQFVENARICSCHFEESDFEKHPVYGYRFLKKTAMPLVFPSFKESIVVLNGNEFIVDEVPDKSGDEDLTDDIIDYNEHDDDDDLIENTNLIIDDDQSTIDDAGENIKIINDKISKEYSNSMDGFIEENSNEEEGEQNEMIEIIVEEVEDIEENVSPIVFNKKRTEKIDKKVDECAIVEEVLNENSNTEYIEAIDEENIGEDKEKRIIKFESTVFKVFCEVCSKGFQYASALKRHFLIHSKVRPFICEICSATFTQKINLDIHMRRHTGEQADKKFKCDVCAKKCARLSELTRHRKSHFKSLPHACSICQQRFPNITTYFSHVKSKHKDSVTPDDAIKMVAENENAEIVECDSVEVYEITLKGDLLCNICSKKCRTPKALKKHKKQMHPKIYTCTECPKQFLYPSLLDKHVRVHTLEKPFSCGKCSQKFAQKINLDVHQKVHNKKKSQQSKIVNEPSLVCSVCSRRFGNFIRYKNHLQGHKVNETLAICSSHSKYNCSTCNPKLSSEDAEEITETIIIERITGDSNEEN